MEMIEVKTAELVGLALDWAVAESICAKPFCTQSGFIILETPAVFDHLLPVGGGRFHPSSDWSLAGPLISQFSIELRPLMGKRWSACAWENGRRVQGDSAEQAICRAIVAAKLGDIAQIPAELA